MALALSLDRVFQHVSGRLALQDLSLELADGAWLLVCGPNGAGKTLLSRLILGLDRPSAGRVQVLGRDLAQTRLAAAWSGCAPRSVP